MKSNRLKLIECTNARISLLLTCACSECHQLLFKDKKEKIMELKPISNILGINSHFLSSYQRYILCKEIGKTLKEINEL